MYYNNTPLICVKQVPTYSFCILSAFPLYNIFENDYNAFTKKKQNKNCKNIFLKLITLNSDIFILYNR